MVLQFWLIKPMENFEQHFIYFEPENNLLHGHLSIENPQATAFKKIMTKFYDNLSKEIMPTFLLRGMIMKTLPTWNYIAVHIW